MSKFHELTVAEVRRETPDAVSIRFDVPDDLAEDFAYVQGQHITLRATINKEEVRRSYSICTGVADNELRVAIKAIPEGRFSNFANLEIEMGDKMDVFPPAGTFHTPLDPAQSKTYVAFAGGSGITPVMSIIRTTLATEPDSRFALVYGNRDARSIIFAEALGRLKDRYLARLEIYHVLEGDSQDVPLFQGRLDREKCDLVLSELIDTPNVDEFFICGPDPMMDAIEGALQAKSVDDAHIHIERFVAADAAPTGEEAAKAAKDAGSTAHAKITATVDGDSFSFDYNETQGNILQAALDADIDVPYSCTGGVCATCRAKVVKGEVEMIANYGLEDDEVEAGFVLTCQSVPKTDEVEVSYDE